MKDTGLKTRKKVLDWNYMKQEIIIKDSFKETYNMDLESIDLKMEIDTKVNGKQVLKMEEVNG